MDKRDPFSSFRSKFHFPTFHNNNNNDDDDNNNNHVIYFCGNSLGLQPKGSKDYVLYELNEWAKKGVDGHFSHDSPPRRYNKTNIDNNNEEQKEKEYKPWLQADENVHEKVARLIVGAKPIEVAIMNGLSVNLHLMMIPFYQPTPERFKILIETKPFPSDLYAVQSQVKFHGYSVEEGVVQMQPREGEICLRTEDIVDKIEKEGHTFALILFAGVQYYTGQRFDIEAITKAAHAKGCMVGFDLAHAVGNVPLRLHEWGPDFACWCSYKYLNSGPGGIAGIFVHERHATNTSLPRLAGWWGQKLESRFDMCQPFDPEDGAFGFRLSNVDILPCALLMGSMDIFDEAGGVEKLRTKSELLTAYLEYLLDHMLGSKQTTTKLTILTPQDIHARGCQLSVQFDSSINVIKVHQLLEKRGVVVDIRKPDVMRIAPVPLYNSFYDVWHFTHLLVDAIQELAK